MLMGQPHPFSSPAPAGGGEKAPRPRDMVGSLVAYSPRSFTKAGTADNLTGVEGGEPRDRVTADLIILESPGPIFYGGSPEWESKPTPHTTVVTGPARFTGVWISNQTIVQALAPGGQPLVGQMVLGRIVRSDVGRRPFNLVDVAGTPDMDRAIEIWSKLQMGALAYNDPQPIHGVAAQPAANSVSYAPPVAAAPPAYIPPAPVAAAVPAQLTPEQQFALWQSQQAALAGPGAPVAAPIPPLLPPAPLGWTAEGWAALNDQQRAMVLASAAPTPR